MSNDVTSQLKPLRLMVIDSPRTTCHMFYKLFQSHPQLAWGRFYHGFNAHQAYGKQRITTKLRHRPAVEQAIEKTWIKPYEEDAEIQKTWPPDLESCVANFRTAVETSESEGKIFFGKEHANFLLKQDLILALLRSSDEDKAFQTPAENPTHIPEDMVKTLKPIFIVRHPVLRMDSFWRSEQTSVGLNLQPTDEYFEYLITLKWARVLYDYFNETLGMEPVILDSDDFVYSTKATMDNFCAMLGLDPEGVKDEWDPVPKESWPKSEVSKVFLGDLLSSRGVIRNAEVSSCFRVL